MMPGYYEQRKHYNYYRVLRQWIDELGPQQSILDIGPMDTPVATWGAFAERWTLGPEARPHLPGVQAARGYWPTSAKHVPLPVSVVTCCQVIEHLKETQEFSAALFAAATKCVIISVPYLWPAGACKYHVHDPIDESKLASLVGRAPDQSTIVTDDNCRRILARYDILGDW
jgi:hypothetical protein